MAITVNSELELGKGLCIKSPEKYCGIEGCIMNTADEYWQYAHECTRWAVEAKNEKDRDAFLDMAKAWTMVALAHSPRKSPMYSADGNEAKPPL